MNTSTTKPEVSLNPPASQRGLRDILRFFSPRWFIAIMGTGALANILQMLSGQATGAMHWAAVSLLTLAVLAFPIAMALILSRLWIDRRMLVKELEHSSLVQFYSAIFIAAAVCATGLIKIPLPIDPGVSLALAKGFWILSLVFGLVLTVFTPWRIITHDHGELRRILGFWFLPPVGLFVLVFAGNFLAVRTADTAWIEGLALLNAILLGIALFQSAIMFTLFFMRALAFPFPRPDIVPSFVIGLAPVGVSIIALLSYLPLLQQVPEVQFVQVAQLAPLVKVLALLLWAFGLWWLAVVVGIVLAAVARKPLPVTLGFWAFVFPPAAYTIATLMLGQATGIGLLMKTGQVLAVVVALAWLAVAFATIRGVINRRIFNLPESFAEILHDAPNPDRNGASGAAPAVSSRASTPFPRPQSRSASI